ncbi:hypothetical protein PanWU01x14_133500 [Parasponia andersonii]|uniref:Uncharacterized protein n=1 Tax=Parasponia andersonii TaxID=3476 RepID=A0A2P5CPW1_PARAD|nr:hypothetical protein PanWU01x14_133500 [Parasponia andersonii]
MNHFWYINPEERYIDMRGRPFRDLGIIMAEDTSRVKICSQTFAIIHVVLFGILILMIFDPIAWHIDFCGLFFKFSLIVLLAAKLGHLSEGDLEKKIAYGSPKFGKIA